MTIRNVLLSLAASSLLGGCYLIPACTGGDCSDTPVDTDIVRPDDTDTTHLPSFDCASKRDEAIEMCGGAGEVSAFACSEFERSSSFSCVGDAPPAHDCTTAAQVATAACGVGKVAGFTCDPNTGVVGATCIVESDGGDINIDVDVTVNQDGTVTVITDDTEPDDTDVPPPAPKKCANGIDDDGDGKIDFGTTPANDPGCSSATDDDEYNAPPTTTCTVTAGGVEFCDGIDNDCDGSVDNNDWDRDGFLSADTNCHYDGLDPLHRQTGDCNDSGVFSGYLHSAFIFPGALELGDWIRSDCRQPVIELDHGCALTCENPANPGHEAYELDGDPAFECVSGYFVADRSSVHSPIDGIYSWTYQSPSMTSAVSYTDMAVTCEATPAVQANPAQWASRDDVRDAVIGRALQQQGVGRNRTELEALLP